MLIDINIFGLSKITRGCAVKESEIIRNEHVLLSTNSNYTGKRQFRTSNGIKFHMAKKELNDHHESSFESFR